MSNKKPIVILDPNFRKMDEIFSAHDFKRLNQMTQVVWGKDEPITEEVFMRHLPNAEIIICGDWVYGDEVLDQAKKLRAIIVVSGGFPENLDYDYCHAHHIRVLSVAPAFARQVAEMALGMALDAIRDISAGDRAMRRGEERYLHEGNISTFSLFDQPVGFIGYGSIARVLQRLLQPFNVRISVYDPWIGEGFLTRMGVQPASIDDVMKTSRVIFVLAAPTIENEALLNRHYLEMIQADAALILMSRAHVVDFDALTEIVLTRFIKVATDVFPVEPLPEDHPIRVAENAVLSAHRAGSVKESLWEIGEMVVDDVEMLIQGLPPRRLQPAEPELVHLYARNRALTPDEVSDER